MIATFRRFELEKVKRNKGLSTYGICLVHYPCVEKSNLARTIRKFVAGEARFLLRQGLYYKNFTTFGY